MQYTYTDTDATEQIHTDFSFIEKFINERSYDYWKKGSGDSAVQIKESERLCRSPGQMVLRYSTNSRSCG